MVAHRILTCTRSIQLLSSTTTTLMARLRSLGLLTPHENCKYLPTSPTLLDYTFMELSRESNLATARFDLDEADHYNSVTSLLRFRRQMFNFCLSVKWQFLCYSWVEIYRPQSMTHLPPTLTIPVDPGLLCLGLSTSPCISFGARSELKVYFKPCS